MLGLFQRLQRARVVKMEDCIELARQIGVEVVTDTFGVRAIDHADGSLEPRLRQQRRPVDLRTQGKEESGNLDVVKAELEAVGQSGSNLLDFAGIVPIGGGSDGAGVGGETDENSFRPVLLAYELSDVDLASPTHLGRARVAEVRVVCPDDDLRNAAAPAQVARQRVDGLRHVSVAQIPG